MKILKLFALFFIGAALIVSCESDLLNLDWLNSGNGNNQRMLSIRLTDNPIDAEEVNVDIQGVMIKTESGFDSVSLDTEAGIYNLLDYQNGADTLIANTLIDFDGVSEIRLILGDDNSIKIDGVLYPLKVPSGSETGLKIKVNIDVTNDQIVEILIDFDALESIVVTDDGEYILNPVITLKDIIKDGDSESSDDDENEGEEGDDGETEGESEEDDNFDEDACLRQKGYWKTHSDAGPAPLDSAWLELENGYDTEFMGTGENYLHFLSIPAGNNRYIRLSQQYIIAELNILAGNEVTEEITQAMTDAKSLLEEYAEQDQIIPTSTDDYDLANELVELLKDYNSGEIVGTSCDDDDSDDGEEEGNSDDDDDDDDDDDSEEEEEDCLRGKGYWKTHSDLGPAPLDEAWLALEDGANTPFFETEKSYMYFLEASGGNNLYIKLAQQYIIAELNVLSGLEIPGEAAEAWEKAGEILAAYAEDMVIGEDDEKDAENAEKTLKKYNGGEMGVPACDD